MMRYEWGLRALGFLLLSALVAVGVVFGIRVHRERAFEERCAAVRQIYLEGRSARIEKGVVYDGDRIVARYRTNECVYFVFRGRQRWR